MAVIRAIWQRIKTLDLSDISITLHPLNALSIPFALRTLPAFERISLVIDAEDTDDFNSCRS